MGSDLIDVEDVHGHHDEELGFPAIEERSKGVLGSDELVGVDRASCVSDVRVFFSGLALWEYTPRYGHVQDKIPLLELDLSDRLHHKLTTDQTRRAQKCEMG